jgi:hypothetical protein
MFAAHHAALAIAFWRPLAAPKPTSFADARHSEFDPKLTSAVGSFSGA